MNKHGGYKGNVAGIIDFSVNINHLGIPARAAGKLKDAIEGLGRYPEIDGASMCAYIEERLKAPRGSVILGNGGIELIYLFARALRPSKAIVVQPTFNEYKRAFEMNGCDVIDFITHARDAFVPDMEKLAAMVRSERPDAVALCSPNNPTGVQTDPGKAAGLLEAVKDVGASLLIDESFIDYSGGASFLDAIGKYPVFIVRSMTKFYAIPGLRLGYCIGNAGIINKIKQHKEPWSVNSLSLSIIPELFEDEEFADRTLDEARRGKAALLEALGAIDGIEVYPPQANFVLCRLERGTGDMLNEYLIRQGYFIRTCTDFCGLGDEYVRIAVRSAAENRSLAGHIRQYMEGVEVQLG
ncbi:putative threonine-phosphate decarboxylase CobD (plasmid) [Peptoclostridium acidaminophilum DSM 3953]|uniref:Aminotransferase n=1 Tax=Peptoclostridium acidaminophilum DSM 3953 TaxID=1286171 RepID=W8T792_PEPAC|nr:threonine-phosphate decarboxylase [Peptoclostridium acidaminophilum]AHM57599.1 putative threonine-phosphate decarboxylase CobD [Peptoclostridium acidaminophilum DSM 3953]